MSKQEQVGGYIAAYNLQDWWLNTFSPEERKYINSRYQPMGAPEHTLTQGKRSPGWKSPTEQMPAAEFLNGLSTWFRKKEDSSIFERIHAKVVELGIEAHATDPTQKPGYYMGRHFTTYVPDVKGLKKQGKLDEAEKLLIQLVGATEAENRASGYQYGVAPWYYEELAKIYRKQKDYATEVTILERYFKQKRAPNKPKLLERLEKAKQLQQKAEAKK